MFKITKNKIKIALFILGILFLLYPIFSNIMYKITQTVAITHYQEQVENMTDEEKEDIKQEFKEYNKKLNEKVVSKIDLLSSIKIVGYIDIPKIGVSTVIKEGTTNSTLYNCVGHLEATSYPGEKNTHCVLAGHSGLSNARIFDDLNKLENEDIVYVTFLDETYSYKVIETKIVDKDAKEEFKVKKDKELLTLITCVPRFINSHRLLVTCERVYNTDKFLFY